MYLDQEKEIFYAVTHTHQRVDGELYENGLIIGSMKTGNLIEKGYCTLKNFSLSPNARSILDMPEELHSMGETFFHVRLLLSKSSLYMFLIENSQVSNISDSLK